MVIADFCPGPMVMEPLRAFPLQKRDGDGRQRDKVSPVG